MNNKVNYLMNELRVCGCDPDECIGCSVPGNVREHADRIEAEIAERFMELPLDADGVPIRVGDELECHANGYDGTFTVFAIGNNVAVGNHDVEWIRRNPSKWFHIASFCTHVKPRTLEDVLDDLQAETIQIFGKRAAGDIDSEMLRTEYADSIRAHAAEIRELLGVSE